MHRVLINEGGPAGRDAIGGAPLLEAREPASCSLCHRTMVPFLQLDIRVEFGLPFKPGSHLIVMMCSFHNEIPELFSERDLPPGFWHQGDGHYLLRLYEPSIALLPRAADVHLQPAALSFELAPEQVTNVEDWLVGSEGFKIGGTPSWAQDPEFHICCCGSEMAFIGQIPRDHAFPKVASAPEQPDSFSADDYCLFLGNETYLFACPRQCHPGAVVPVLQN